MPDLIRLGEREFERLFGAAEGSLPHACRELAGTFDFGLRVLEGGERDRLIADLLRRIHDPGLATSGAERQADWVAGWAQNLARFESSGGDPASLVPLYFKAREPVRLEGRYCMPLAEHFYLRYTDLFRHWLFRRYFCELPALYEFGCGSCAHLAFLGTLFPEKPLFGLDWAEPAVEIARLLGRRLGFKADGMRFDFFAPDKGVRLAPGAGVLTFGALEQVGERFGPFLDFLLGQEIGLVLHVEGFPELYDQADLLDLLALLYHRRRGYLSGLLPRLRELEREGRIEVLGVHRHRLGVLTNDTYSYVAWRPAGRRAWK